MKRIKTFEELNFDNFSWTTTKDFLNLYYQCDSCNSLFKSFNKKIDKCPYCECPDLNNLQKEDYYKEQENRINKDEMEDEIEDSKTLIDLPSALINREKKNITTNDQS